MNEAGEKTEQATPKRLEEALREGNIPKSQEVQTVFVLLAGTLALLFTGQEMWRHLVSAQHAVLGHLHDLPVTSNSVRLYTYSAVLLLAKCVTPVLIAIMVGGTLAGGLQSRFQTASEALEPKWKRLNPVEGIKRLFSVRSTVTALTALLKLVIIAALSYSVIKEILQDPIFYSTVHPQRIVEFIAEAALKLLTRLIIVMILIAAADYAFQFWKHRKDMMMTKQEVKDENKNSEGDPQVKARQRRRRMAIGQRQMLADVPQADVVITNPTHYAVALRYDRKTMKAPKIVAKGMRKFALRIREIANQNQIPIVENKPVARMMYKYGKVGGDIPAELYSAVAEILAYVYRTNRYRYWRELNQSAPDPNLKR